jgi:hypothetical protein
MQEASNSFAQSPPRSTPERDRETKREDDELAALSGKTRLVTRKNSSAPSSPESNPGSATSPQVTSFQIPPLSATYSPNVMHSNMQSVYPVSHEQSQTPISPSSPQQIIPTPILDPLRQWQGHDVNSNNHPAILPTGLAFQNSGAGRVDDFTRYTNPPEPWQNDPSSNLTYPNAPQTAPTYVPSQSYSQLPFDYSASVLSSSYLTGSEYQRQQQQHQQQQQQIIPQTIGNDMDVARDPVMAWHSFASQFQI